MLIEKIEDNAIIDIVPIIAQFALNTIAKTALDHQFVDVEGRDPEQIQTGDLRDRRSIYVQIDASVVAQSVDLLWHAGVRA